jgi:hypothetical protein
MVKYQFLHESEAYKMMLEVGVPADMVKPALSRFRGRLGTRRCAHFHQLRCVIGEATGVQQLQVAADVFNKVIDREALMKACQSKQFWDLKLEPYDVSWLSSGNDQLGSELFINLVELWIANIYPSLKTTIRIDACPPLEEFVLMLRMVRNIYFQFSLLTSFFVRSVNTGVRPSSVRMGLSCRP